MKIGKLAWKAFKLLVTLVLTLAALAVLGLVFWTQVKHWLYDLRFIGNDTPQFIHYVFYYLKNPHFPVNAWDYFWHNGVPRIVDLAWLHHSLSAFLAKTIGVYKAVKIYPMISFGLGILFVYLLFYELSKSILLSLGLAISFVLSEGYYIALFSGGVVLSAISQMFLPAQLYFLVRFAKKGNYRNLLFGSLMSVLGLASHGLMMMFFGFIPAFFFVLFSNRETNSLVSKKTVFNAAVFAIATLTVGAFVVWPFLLQASQGGSTTTFWGGLAYDPDNFKNMSRFSNSGVAYGYVAAVIVAFAFWLFKRKPDRIVRPASILLLGYLLWMLSYTVGGNPVYSVLFPGRIFWVWPLFLGCLASVLLLPLSKYEAPKLGLRAVKFFGFGLVKLVIFLVIIISPVCYFGNRDNFLNQIKRPQIWETFDIAERYREGQKDLLELVNPKRANVRLWSHDTNLNMRWITISDMPLSEGYAHIWTYYSRLWEGWFYGVMSYSNWESQEIPREMAKQQALFFLDWYGVKYMAAIKDGGEWEVASHFYQDSPYIEKSKVYKSGRSVFVVSPEYTSPVVAPVATPVVGFVGDDEAYMTFFKDIAMLKLDTSYLIPVKIANSISRISSRDLALVDGLVIYDFKKTGVFYSRGWDKVLNFVRNGGKVWIEGGGNSGERENPQLPAVFPITASQYGPLDKNWQPGGKLANKIDFSSLEPLVYRETPWQISYAPKKAVKSGAKTLLTQKGYPVAVEQEVGKGKVLWTGVNFWYRPEEYRKNGMEEVKLVKLFLESLMGELSPKQAQAQVERKAPEHIKVTGQEFSGVVFKETNWGGWRATVEAGGKRKGVPIFTAGPEVMYIPIPKDMREGNIKVLINYQGSAFYWLCFVVSLASFLVVVLYLIFGDLVLRRLVPKKITRYYPKKIKSKISSWWESEED
ncbi:MAG TPA: hypothetical protein VMX76_01745 [Nevskiaceae bacterium]|nr:hypothetical protein [Nevskiaceae bacterium]